MKIGRYEFQHVQIIWPGGDSFKTFYLGQGRLLTDYDEDLATRYGIRIVPAEWDTRVMVKAKQLAEVLDEIDRAGRGPKPTPKNRSRRAGNGTHQP